MDMNLNYNQGQNQRRLGIHEALELHELVTFKAVCASKSAAMMNIVSDSELRSLMQQDLEMAQQHIQRMQPFLEGAQYNLII